MSRLVYVISFYFGRTSSCLHFIYLSNVTFYFKTVHKLTGECHLSWRFGDSLPSLVADYLIEKVILSVDKEKLRVISIFFLGLLLNVSYTVTKYTYIINFSSSSSYCCLCKYLLLSYFCYDYWFFKCLLFYTYWSSTTPFASWIYDYFYMESSKVIFKDESWLFKPSVSKNVWRPFYKYF